MERKEKFSFEDLYGPKVGPAIDATPVAVPLGFRKPETMEERLKRFIRRELSEEADRAGADTFDEANDFDLPDDPVDPSTPFEEFFDPALGRAITPHEMQLYEAQYRERYLRTQADKIAFEDRQAAFEQAVENARKNRSAGAGGGHNPPPPRLRPENPLRRPRRPNFEVPRAVSACWRGPWSFWAQCTILEVHCAR